MAAIDGRAVAAAWLNFTGCVDLQVSSQSCLCTSLFHQLHPVLVKFPNCHCAAAAMIVVFSVIAQCIKLPLACCESA